MNGGSRQEGGTCNNQLISNSVGQRKKNIRLISALTGFPYFPAPCNQVFDEVKLNIAKEKTRQLAESLSPFARKSACKGNFCIDSKNNSFEEICIAEAGSVTGYKGENLATSSLPKSPQK